MMGKTPEIARPINLGNLMETSIGNLAEFIVRKTSSRSKLEHAPRRKDAPHRHCPDISGAKEALSWLPVITREDGLKETIGLPAPTKQVIIP